MSKLARSMFVGVFLLVGAGFVHASPITLTYLNNLGNPTGTISGVNPTIRAGEFHFAVAGDTPYWDDRLQAFCLQTDTFLQSSAQYTVELGLDGFNQPKRDNINRLFSNYYAASGSSAVNSAAFQLALWEIINETGDSLDLYQSGSFRSSSFSGARALANGWLANLGQTSSAYEYFVLRSANSQDLITVRNVPEPGTLMLLGAGLVAMGWARRRRAC